MLTDDRHSYEVLCRIRGSTLSSYPNRKLNQPWQSSTMPSPQLSSEDSKPKGCAPRWPLDSQCHPPSLLCHHRHTDLKACWTPTPSPRSRGDAASQQPCPDSTCCSWLPATAQPGTHLPQTCLSPPRPRGRSQACLPWLLGEYPQSGYHRSVRNRQCAQVQ